MQQGGPGPGPGVRGEGDAAGDGGFRKEGRRWDARGVGWWWWWWALGVLEVVAEMLAGVSKRDGEEV